MPSLPFGLIQDYVPVDFSVGNPYWKTHDVTSAIEQQRYLNSLVQNKHKTVGYGGFLEKRGLYDASERFQVGEKRNIHLGLDLWTYAGTPVRAVMDGEVHSFGYLADLGNYGGVIILRHIWQGDPIFGLYGHLGRDSIAGLREGVRFRESEIIGYLGSPRENGGYAPHLHLQFMRDMQGYKGDYPGVSSKEQLQDLLDNLIDPTSILGL